MVRLGKYKHYKGREYQVIAVGSHSETLESVVVYQELYGGNNVWVRPEEMFKEDVLMDNQKVPRFSLIKAY